ncbi:MAG TPA: hypothetical protein VHA11_11775 [Bryobacteraceae bacterium]|nr:hypothetical protein [Bryobacteraceae bacterium]
MRVNILLLAVLALLPLAAQSGESVVSKDSVSVHTVRRGNMPLRWRASGTLQSIDPPRALVTPIDGGSAPCRKGQGASVQVEPGKIATGKVVEVLEGENGARARCRIELSASLPAGTSTGKEVGALLDAGEIADTIYFERPADASAHSDAVAFVIEPDEQHARRVSVRYGELSGALIQILSGLSVGDRVIVTDMSRWRGSERVRLE